MATNQPTETATDGLWNTIKESLKNLAELRIVTAVGETDVTNRDGRVQVAFKQTSKTEAIETKIDLLAGDITTKMDPAYIQGDLASLREFHAAQVEKGSQIITRNIEFLISTLRSSAKDLQNKTSEA